MCCFSLQLFAHLRICFMFALCLYRWPEIQSLLSHKWETAWNRPDIVMRVWQQKKNQLLKDVLEDGVLGAVEGFGWAMEFQVVHNPCWHDSA